MHPEWDLAHCKVAGWVVACMPALGMLALGVLVGRVG